MGDRGIRRKKEIRVVDPRKVVGYIRVSTDDQALSVVAQRENLAQWCRVKGFVLVAVEVDEGVSGSTPIVKRPGLMAAFDEVQSQGAGVLLAVRRDRLARDTMIAAQIESFVRRNGGMVRTVHGDFEQDTPENRLMKTLADAFAEYQLAAIRLATLTVMRSKKARGEVTGAVEYGYSSVSSPGPDKVKMAVPNPVEQAALAAIKQYSLEGMPYGLMVAKLTIDGHLPRGGGRWTPELIKRRKMQLGVHPDQLAKKGEPHG